MIIVSEQALKIFPRCAEACERVALTNAASRQRTAAEQESRQRHQLAAAAAYAEELLPLVLGGTSRRTSSAINPYEPDGRLFNSRELFDHPLVYRHRGTRGPLTRRDAAVIGMPYATLDDTGEPTDDALRAARALGAIGIGVWARPDLSAWLPGSTRLVIAAPDLYEPGPLAAQARAAEFGFRAIV